MGFLNRILGREEETRARPEAPTSGHDEKRRSPTDPDEQALERYRYMLKTAPPETIEAAHEEAFAKLTPEQRSRVLGELASQAPEGERSALTGNREDPKSLARLTTRAEMRRPGTMERTFGNEVRGSGVGGMMGGTIFASLAAGFVGSMIAQQFLGSTGDSDEDDPNAEPEDEQADEGAGGDVGEAGDDFGGDF